MNGVPFEPLAHVYKIRIADVPSQWLPLVYIFDPDLPLFPLQYFHVLPIDLTDRPSISDRAYGYIRSVSIDIDNHELTAEIVCNKDLANDRDRSRFLSPITNAVANRLGTIDPVTISDIRGLFPSLPATSLKIRVLEEIWHRVVDNAYGGKLPFGAFSDPVAGLARYYASWNPPQGRKSELIQTHYFISRFGERIVSAGNLPAVDLFLLPTWDELTDIGNPLGNFPKFSNLVTAAHDLCQNPDYFSQQELNNWSYTGFKVPQGTRIAGVSQNKLNRPVYEHLVSEQSVNVRETLIECFNAFDKGAPRTIIFLMYLNDIRQLNSKNPLPGGGPKPRIHPARLSAPDAADLIIHMNGYYQSPKAISIYAQQCHGNHNTLPVDTWIGAFLEWPLASVEYDPVNNVVRQTVANRERLFSFISAASGLGKAERLLWITAQARKIHSSACSDSVWCIKASRGANPLSCKICTPSIRSACPAFFTIMNKMISFNNSLPTAAFEITTEKGNNTDPGQRFISCKGTSVFAKIEDSESSTDSPGSFASFPVGNHVHGVPITTAQFISMY